ncbi:MAG: hypothetical protein KME08_20810 [Aphanothece sp. CMT-3BRIN-NPC111]|jgi:hypothetical protein|nr:hypothetical protein [Aphanothece sp. CMT-3BRIN-NPC111]
MRLLWGAIVSLGLSLSALPAQAQVADTQVGTLVEALRLAAPQTGTENDGLYSDWQILPANIPRWSKRCIGRALTITEFEASPATARGILVCVMRDVLRDQYRASGNNESVAVQRAAAWWMTGDATRYNSSQTAPYTKKVLGFYQQLRSKPTSTPAASTQPKPTSPPAASTQPKPTTPPAVSTQPKPTTPPAVSTQPKPITQSPPNPPAQRVGDQPAQVSDAQVGALVEALRQGAPKTGTQNDGLYSEWQIKADNIPRWSKQCIGRPLTTAQFESSPVTARQILVCVMRDVLQEQYRASDNNESVAVQRAAAWWMTGDATRYNSNQTASYTQKILGFYQQLRSDKPAQPTLFPHV